MNTQHTPGEWKVTELYPSAYSVTIGPIDYIDSKGSKKQGWKQIANISGGYFSAEQAEANARLIAAAPELLKAAQTAQSIADKCNHSMQPPHVQDLLRSISELLLPAINKATNS